MRVLFIAIGALMIAAGSACANSARPEPPSAAPSANAMLESYAPLYGGVKAGTTADVILTARCRSSEEFAEERRGAWNHFWYIVNFEVLTVEKGSWDLPEVSFICMDAWPTPESGIMLNKAPWPYRPAVRMRFWLDGTKTPAQILGQQDLASAIATLRSPIP